MLLPYNGKVWLGESLANLANRPWSAKLNKYLQWLTVINLLADLLICQTFFCQILKNNQFVKFSHHTVLLLANLIKHMYVQLSLEEGNSILNIYITVNFYLANVSHKSKHNYISYLVIPQYIKEHDEHTLKDIY